MIVLLLVIVLVIAPHPRRPHLHPWRPPLSAPSCPSRSWILSAPAPSNTSSPSWSS